MGFGWGCVPADFLLSGGGYYGGFFWWIFFGGFRDLKNRIQKNHHFHGGFCKTVESTLKPKQAVSQLRAQHWYPPLKLESGMAASFSFLPCLRNSQSKATAPQETQRKARFKPNKLIGKEITHSKARRQAEVYTQDQDGNTKLIARLEERRFKSRNQKILPRKSSLQKWQPNDSWARTFTRLTRVPGLSAGFLLPFLPQTQDNKQKMPRNGTVLSARKPGCAQLW